MGQLSVQGTPTRTRCIWEIIIEQAYLMVEKVSEKSCKCLDNRLQEQKSQKTTTKPLKVIYLFLVTEEQVSLLLSSMSFYVFFQMLALLKVFLVFKCFLAFWIQSFTFLIRLWNSFFSWETKIFIKILKPSLSFNTISVVKIPSFTELLELED